MDLDKCMSFSDFIKESKNQDKTPEDNEVVEENEETNNDTNNEVVEENEDDTIEDGSSTDDVETPSEEDIPTETNLENVGDIDEQNDVDPDLDIRTDIESDGELDGNTIPENDYPTYDEYMTQAQTEIPTGEIAEEGGVCRVVIINGCEPETPVDTKTDELKEKLQCECEEIYLYQLNIQSPKKQEPRDGMEMIYGKVEEADAIIFACESKKGALSPEFKNVIDRLKSHYTESELKNKVFGAIIIGKEDEKLQNELILCAINGLNMIVGGDCVYVGAGDSADLSTMAICLKSLCTATESIRGSYVEPENADVIDHEIETYGEFVDREQTEEPNDQSLPNDLPEEGTEENDDFVAQLKGDIEDGLSSDDDDSDDDDDDDDNSEEEEGIEAVEDDMGSEEEENVEEKVEEEEERLIDNLDGTVTHIHRGWKDTNRPKGKDTRKKD